MSLGDKLERLDGHPRTLMLEAWEDGTELRSRTETSRRRRKEEEEETSRRREEKRRGGDSWPRYAGTWEERVGEGGVLLASLST